MRMLSYKLELCGHSYIVANGEVEGYDSWNGRSCQPIKFSIINCHGNLNDSIIKDGWDQESIPAAKCFYEHYQEILHNGCEDWHLYSFEVTPGCLILNFYNGCDDCSCCLIIDGIYSLKVQFDIPRQNNGSESHYLVEIFNVRKSSNSLIIDKKARVVECLGNIRRELEFRGMSSDAIDKKQYVFVTEYADL